jgi:hypothetical protein
LLKTFWSGVGGWKDQQLPDGTVQFSSPSGRSYSTKPGGGQLFPILATPTGEVAIGKPSGEQGPRLGLSPASGRCPQMPRRKRTRAEDLQDRITAERRINEARIAEERRKHQAWLAATYEPPPF